MEENRMKLDCSKRDQIIFSRKFKVLLWIGIVLTGCIVIGAMPTFLYYGITEKVWLEMGMNWFLFRILEYLTIAILFVVLIKILAVKRPFSATLVHCIMVIGMMCLIASIAFPQITGFQKTDFQILGFTENFYIEGNLFLAGILAVIFGQILSYGFRYQQESDETL